MKTAAQARAEAGAASIPVPVPQILMLGRDAIEELVELLIAYLDQLDGDPDLEDDGCTEDDGCCEPDEGG